ncbi:MAG TPA: hypothetical protein DEG13_04175 [Candidatus Microthrix parvicella]|nr:hypothetical protein [Candidatus Microthrix parvicella]
MSSDVPNFVRVVPARAAGRPGGWLKIGGRGTELVDHLSEPHHDGRHRHDHGATFGLVLVTAERRHRACVGAPDQRPVESVACRRFASDTPIGAR